MVVDQVGEVHETQCAVHHEGGDALDQRLEPRRGVLPSLPPARGEAAQQAGRPARHHGGRREQRLERTDDQAHPLGHLPRRVHGDRTQPQHHVTAPGAGSLPGAAGWLR